MGLRLWKFWTAVLPGATLLVLAACTSPQVQMTGSSPPQSLQAAKFQRVAVLPFGGPGGDGVATRLESMLTETTVGGQPYFIVVDRRTLDRALQELKLGTTGLVDPKSAAQIGRFANASGVYIGTVTSSGVDPKWHTEKRTECASGGATKSGGGVLGGLLKKCTQTIETNVQCYEKTSHIDVVPRLVSVETGQVVYSPTRRGTASARGCANDGQPPTDRELQDLALNDAILQIRRDVAPYEYKITTALKTSVEGLSGPDSAASFTGALSFSKSGRFDRACDIWRNLRQRGENTVALRYDLAICAEAEGDLRGSLTQVQDLDRSLTAPDPDINDSLARLQRRLAETGTLQISAPSGASTAPTARTNPKVIPTKF